MFGIFNSIVGYTRSSMHLPNFVQGLYTPHLFYLFHMYTTIFHQKNQSIHQQQLNSITFNHRHHPNHRFVVRVLFDFRYGSDLFRHHFLLLYQKYL